LIVFGFGVPFSNSYEVFTACRFLLGVATAGTMVVSFVIVMETVGPKYRELVGCLFQIPFIIGHMTVPLFAYYFRY
jgi:MFS family permease